MTDSHHIWDEDPPEVRSRPADAVREKRKIDGRFVLYRNICPMCGGRCPVVNKTRTGFPRIKCKKYGKLIECVYEDV